MATIRSIVVSLINSGTTPTMRDVTQHCIEAGIRPPATPASLMATISQVRRDMGLTPTSRAVAEPAPAPIPEPEPIEMSEMPEMPDVGESDPMFTPPRRDPSFVVASHARAVMNATHTMARAGENPLILMTGPAGTGKTSFARELAARTNRPYFEVSTPNFREARDFFGCKTLDNEFRPVWMESQLLKALRRGNCVICLDECNRAHPSVANTLLPLLDHRRGCFFEEIQKTISVGPGTIWVGTANLGREYAGVFALDKALRDRFATVIEVDYLPVEEEIKLLTSRVPGLSTEQAESLVGIATQTRGLALENSTNALSGCLSTRQLLNAAKYLVTGGKSTLIATIANHYPNAGSGSQRERVLALITGKFGNIMEEAK